MRHLPTAALIGIVAGSIALQLGFWLFGWREILLPPQENTQREIFAVWPPLDVMQRHLGDIPVTGLPFLLALPFAMLIAFAYLRDNNRRGVGVALTASCCFGFGFLLLQLIFVQEASFGFGSNFPSARVFWAMGYFGFVVGFGVLLQIANLFMLWVRWPGSTLQFFLMISLLYWGAASLAWLFVLVQLLG